MGFLGIYRAIYDYAPQGEGELEIAEGDLLFVLEKSTEDDWWKAKKKAMSDEEDEPEGLIPANYIEEVSWTSWPIVDEMLTGSIGTTNIQSESTLRLHTADG